MSRDQHTTERAPGTGPDGPQSAQNPPGGTERRPGAPNEAQTGAQSFERFDRDPEALAWARAHIQAYLDRLTEFEATANHNRNAVMAYSCGVARELTRKHFLGDGDGDGVVGIFDERRLDKEEAK